VRLNVEKLKDNIRNLNNIPITLQYDILHTIRVLQQENEQLKEQINTAKIGWDTYKTYSEQYIEKLKATLADWKYNAKCDADHIAALTADKDEQTEQMKYLLRRTLPILEVTNDQQELIDAINALLGGKEDV
jgi:hypothetical protein